MGPAAQHFTAGLPVAPSTHLIADSRQEPRGSLRRPRMTQGPSKYPHDVIEILLNVALRFLFLE